MRHLINYTGPTGIAQRRMDAGEGRRDMLDDLRVLYEIVFRHAAAHQALNTTPAIASDAALYSAEVMALRDAQWIRVPAPDGGLGLHFVAPRQLCLDLEQPNGGFFPEPPELCDTVPAEARRAFLLALGAVSAQQGAPLPPPLPTDAASRQVRPPSQRSRLRRGLKAQDARVCTGIVCRLQQPSLSCFVIPCGNKCASLKCSSIQGHAAIAAASCRRRLR